ncbi:hypothetical protein ACSBR2_036819 [Camellia fascicularis]
MYKVARASKYLVITGVGIPDIKIAKKAWILPGQCLEIIDVSPVNYTFEVQAVSAEKLPFVFSAAFIVGPHFYDDASLLKYAKLISPHDKLSNHVKDLVQGIIEGETRVVAASMTIEEIFRGIKKFKQGVFQKVQVELNQFGLLIYNANVRQLVDVPGHEYISYLGQKTQMEAANQAKINVAEAKMKGDIGAKLREGQTLQNAAKIDLDTKIISTQRQGEGKKEKIRIKTEVKVFDNLREAAMEEANAELVKKKAGWAREAQVAEVEAMKAVALRDTELQREVEIMHGLTRTEKLKAEFLSKATVEYEIKVQEANWELYQKQKTAEAILYQKKKETEAQRAIAEAAFFAERMEAKGLIATAQAQGLYIRMLFDTFKVNYSVLKDSLITIVACFNRLSRLMVRLSMNSTKLYSQFEKTINSEADLSQENQNLTAPIQIKTLAFHKSHSRSAYQTKNWKKISMYVRDPWGGLLEINTADSAIDNDWRRYLQEFDKAALSRQLDETHQNWTNK